MATTVKLQYWPVLSRDTTINGKLKRGGYKRTALALQEREEKLVRLETRTRAILTWGGDAVSLTEFSLNTGRCIGNPDWVMMKESRKALRKLAREQFPKEAANEGDGAYAGPPAPFAENAPYEGVPDLTEMVNVDTEGNGPA